MLRQSLRSLSRHSRIAVISGRRTFVASRASLEATIFDMPAMSPTMESGAIVEWKVKEGESFNSGDPILDIETDKATISVDAIDNGILAKILLPDGTKDIDVGTPIAFIAEEGDDLSSLKFPEVESKSEAPKKEEPKAEPVVSSEPAPQPTSVASVSTDASSSSTAANPSQTFFPSVELLLHQNKISRDDAISKIPATGPNGRILKGDVLAFLGKISANENQKVASYLEKHTHLDLSNIQLREKVVEDKQSSAPKSNKKEPVILQESYPLDLEISYPQLKSFKEIISTVIEAAEQHAYAINLNKPSDLDDPLFEDLIAPARNAERFSINYKLNMTDNEIESLDLQLTLNEKCFDAKDRAEVFVLAFKDILLESVKPYQNSE